MGASMAKIHLRHLVRSRRSGRRAPPSADVPSRAEPEFPPPEPTLRPAELEPAVARRPGRRSRLMERRAAARSGPTGESTPGAVAGARRVADRWRPWSPSIGPPTPPCKREAVRVARAAAGRVLPDFARRPRPGTSWRGGARLPGRSFRGATDGGAGGPTPSSTRLARPADREHGRYRVTPATWCCWPDERLGPGTLKVEWGRWRGPSRRCGSLCARSSAALAPAPVTTERHPASPPPATGSGDDRDRDRDRPTAAAADTAKETCDDQHERQFRPRRPRSRRRRPPRPRLPPPKDLGEGDLRHPTPDLSRLGKTSMQVQSS